MEDVRRQSAKSVPVNSPCRIFSASNHDDITLIFAAGFTFPMNLNPADRPATKKHKKLKTRILNGNETEPQSYLPGESFYTMRDGLDSISLCLLCLFVAASTAGFRVM